MLRNEQGHTIDNLRHRVNIKGYLIDEFGNIIYRDGRQMFEKRQLFDEEIPKFFHFTKFTIKNVQGDYELDPKGLPILGLGKAGIKVDRRGRRVNLRGFLVDKTGNVLDRWGKRMFEKILLDFDGNIPKVFRIGLLATDSGSSSSRLLNDNGETGVYQPSFLSSEEHRLQDEINMLKLKGDVSSLGSQLDR